MSTFDIDAIEVRLKASAEFTAHARDDVAVLVNEVRRLEREVGRLRSVRPELDRALPMTYRHCPECQGWDLVGRPTSNHARTCSRRPARWLDVDRAGLAADRARQIASDPSAASDADKLRSLADFFDVYDTTQETTGSEVQEFLRSLAARSSESEQS